MNSLAVLFSFLLILLLSFPCSSEEKQVFLREDFKSLDNWRPLYFPGINKHTEYSIEKKGEESYLRAYSSSSASGIVFKKEFNVYKYPVVRWMWKISNIYIKGNAGKKSGDDYPIRIYINFNYDPGKASFGKRIRYGFAKTIYGEYPPDSTLNYIWANRKHNKNILTNTYAEKARMIILRTGAENTGKWQEQEVNILKDYRMAFNTDPLSVATIAVMNDSDNTKESSISYVDFIEIYR